jgi:hypothetical protein
LEDLVKLGLAGNLEDYTFTDSTGSREGLAGRLQRSPAGYAADPSETITYVDAHDNETLFDALQYKLPTGTSMADRVRMNTVAPATTALGQTVVLACGQRHPAVEVAGPELLQLRDWFKPGRLVERRQTWGSGYAGSGQTSRSGTSSGPCCPTGAGAELCRHPAAHAAAESLLAIRAASPLAQAGQRSAHPAAVSFPNSGPDATPGVIVMAIDEPVGPRPRSAVGGQWSWCQRNRCAPPRRWCQRSRLVVPAAPGAGRRCRRVVKESTYAAGTFNRARRTVAVFLTR